uniref:Putative RNA dependent RNA polymerase n=1 Tax=Ruian virus TaxID=2656660 RepID=A0A5P8PNY7_9VIRU|nr:MAG: putative RNA dependent RNA polymerase [Ruian virus]
MESCSYDVGDTPKVNADWTAPARTGRLAIPRPADYQDVLDEWLGGVGVDVSGWHHSSAIEGELQTKALSMLFTHKDESKEVYDVDLIVDALILHMCDFETPELSGEDVTVEKLMDQPTNTCGSGPINVSPNFGAQRGSKSDLQAAAAKAAMEPVLHCHGRQPKDETLKRGKKLRFVIPASYSKQMLDVHFFGNKIYRHNTIVDGGAVGISRVKGNALKPLMKIYLVWAKNTEELTGETPSWEDFIEITSGQREDPNGLITDKANEMDCQAWEFTLNESSVVHEVYDLLECVNIKNLGDQSKKLLANTLAHTQVWFLKIEGHTGCFVTFKKASGELNTAGGNTARHRGGQNGAMAIYQRHGWATACSEDKCWICKKTRLKREQFPIGVLSMSYMGSTLYGDDDYAPDTPASGFFAKAMDAYIGTRTISEPKPYFATEEVDGAKFLQVELAIDECGKVVTKRARERVIAKLVKTPRARPAMLAAIVSACFEVGHDKELIAHLTDLFCMLREEVTEEEIERHLGEFVVKGDGVSMGRPPTHQEVILTQDGFFKPMLTVQRQLEHTHGF